MKNVQRRHWMATVWPNHLGLDVGCSDHELIDAMESFWETLSSLPGLKYAVGQIERSPETGNLHIQAYTEWGSSKRLSEVVKIFPAHLEFRKGSRDDARDYCRKKKWKGNDKGQVKRLPEFGEWRASKEQAPSPKQRALDYLTKGFVPADILRMDPEVYFTHYRSIEAVYNLMEKAGITLCAADEEE
jgi:hypothetical protein